MFRFVSRDRFPFCVSAATGLFSFSVGLVNAFYVFFFYHSIFPPVLFYLPEFVSCACGYNAVNYDAKSQTTHRNTLVS